MSDDRFYLALTDRQRGSSEMIASRLGKTYQPFVQALKQCFGGGTTLDLGCGRGEWLELLAAEGFDARGIDLDEDMVDACRARGLAAEKQDARTALTGMADESLVLVTGFHIVEHMPFDDVRALMREALRALQPGGLLVFETPNPENILVSTSGFHLDPTHRQPIPLHLLAFAAEHAGFARVRVLRLYESPDIAAKPAIGLMDVLGGASPDYAVVAQKRAGEAETARFDEAFRGGAGIMLDALADRYDGQIQSRIAEVGTRCVDAESRIREAESRLDHLQARLDQAESRAAQAEQQLRDLYASHSWRLTRPLRWLSSTLRRNGGERK